MLTRVRASIPARLLPQLPHPCRSRESVTAQRLALPTRVPASRTATRVKTRVSIKASIRAKPQPRPRPRPAL